MLLESVLLVFLLALKAPSEEPLMLAGFGSLYERYRRHVPELIPDGVGRAERMRGMIDFSSRGQPRRR